MREQLLPLASRSRETAETKQGCGGRGRKHLRIEDGKSKGLEEGRHGCLGTAGPCLTASHYSGQLGPQLPHL